MLHVQVNEKQSQKDLMQFYFSTYLDPIKPKEPLKGAQ